MAGEGGTSSGSGDDGFMTESRASSASIYVKDAPTDEFSEIHVVFTKVEVHAAGDEDADGNETSDDGNETSEVDNETADDDANETDEDDGGWITLFENANGTDVDLLAASGDASAFLGEADLEPGKYTQIRITVASAYGVSLDGNDTVNITVSSGTLKIVKPFDVIEGEEAKITVDYDLDRSLKQQGNGKWRMTPVVGSVVVEHVDDDESGEDAHDEGEISGGDDEESDDEDDSGSEGNETAEDDNTTA